MDIAALASANSQTQLMMDVSTAMMKKSLDSMESTGNNMVQMMEQSVTPNLGSNIDIRL